MCKKADFYKCYIILFKLSQTLRSTGYTNLHFLNIKLCVVYSDKRSSQNPHGLWKIKTLEPTQAGSFTTLCYLEMDNRPP